VPLPVPGKLFWSVTAYDAETRSQVQTDQGKAALRSLFELKDKAGENSVDLYFGPNAPAGKEGQWIKTNPRKGWFGDFRIYGPEQAAFDGSWKPGDFEEVVANTASPSRPRHCRPTPNAVKPEYAADWQLRGRPYRLETANAPRHTVTSLLCDAQCGRGDSQSTVDGRRGKHLDEPTIEFRRCQGCTLDHGQLSEVIRVRRVDLDASTEQPLRRGACRLAGDDHAIRGTVQGHRIGPHDGGSKPSRPGRPCWPNGSGNASGSLRTHRPDGSGNASGSGNAGWSGNASSPGLTGRPRWAGRASRAWLSEGAHRCLMALASAAAQDDQTVRLLAEHCASPYGIRGHHQSERHGEHGGEPRGVAVWFLHVALP